MHCRNPYMAPGNIAYGCGQCLPCRINTRRMWAHRILLECTQHPVNSFWTLTYDDAHLPLSKSGLPTLMYPHLTLFLKRLRWDYQQRLGMELRYFAVGEYGTRTQRPHYHLALFNYPSCDRGASFFNRRGNCCPVCDRVQEIWGQGSVYAGQLEDASATYISGYITKKLNSKDPALGDRQPEQSRKSLKPGIGAGFIPELASTILKHSLEEGLEDVPTQLQHGVTKRPLGRYLTRKLREQVGKSPDAPPSVLQAKEEEMQPLRDYARQVAAPGTYRETLKAVVVSVSKGRVDQMEARARIFKKRETL